MLLRCVIYWACSSCVIYIFMFRSNILLTIIMGPAHSPLSFILHDNKVLVTYTLPAIFLCSSIFTSYYCSVHLNGPSKATLKESLFYFVICLLFFTIFYILNMLHCCGNEYLIIPRDTKTLGVQIFIAFGSAFGIIIFLTDVKLIMDTHNIEIAHQNLMLLITSYNFSSILCGVFSHLCILYMISVNGNKSDLYLTLDHVFSTMVSNTSFILCCLSAFDGKLSHIIPRGILTIISIYSMSYCESVLTGSGELGFCLFLASNMMGVQLSQIYHNTNRLKVQCTCFVLKCSLFIITCLLNSELMELLTLTDLDPYLLYSFSISYSVAFYCQTTHDFRLVKTYLLACCSILLMIIFNMIENMRRVIVDTNWRNQFS